MKFRNLENIDRRVLGALRFVDAVTGSAVKSPMKVEAEGVSGFFNRRGYFVLTAAPGLDAHTDAFFAPPDTPQSETIPLELRVYDPTGVFLPRRKVIRLPRVIAPQSLSAIARPIEVEMFRSPTGRSYGNWAIIRATVLRDVTEERLGGALIRVFEGWEDGGRLLARGMSDTRGEALVLVPGLRFINWQDGDESENEDEEGGEAGSVTRDTVPITLHATHDAAADSFPDPDDLALRIDLPTTTTTRAISAGSVRSETVHLRAMP